MSRVWSEFAVGEKIKEMVHITGILYDVLMLKLNALTRDTTSELGRHKAINESFSAEFNFHIVWNTRSDWIFHRTPQTQTDSAQVKLQVWI